MTDMTDTITQLVRRADAQEQIISRYGSFIVALMARYAHGSAIRLATADFDKAKGMSVQIEALKSGFKLTLKKQEPRPSE